MWNIDNKATHNTLMGEIEREREREIKSMRISNESEVQRNLSNFLFLYS